MIAACALLLILLGINANLLPTWMFINSMQLIMHTALLTTNMPSNLHFFLFHYLNILRLNPEALDLSVEAKLSESGLIDYELSNKEDVFFNTVLGMCGYKHALSRNLLIIICISLCILIVGLVLWLVDSIFNRKSDRRLTVFMSNFSLRFFYEFFLEICIGTFIHIASMQVLHKDFEAQISIVSWVMASLYLVGIIGFVGFIASRFWRHGPYVKSTYLPGSLRHSWWGIRLLSKTSLRGFEATVAKESQETMAAMEKIERRWIEKFANDQGDS